MQEAEPSSSAVSPVFAAETYSLAKALESLVALPLMTMLASNVRCTPNCVRSEAPACAGADETERPGSRAGHPQPDNALDVSVEDGAKPAFKRGIRFRTAGSLRGLIKPRSGHALVYVDWSQQELRLRRHCRTDACRKRICRATPTWHLRNELALSLANATKGSHAAVREQYKACVLAVQYGVRKITGTAHTTTHGLREKSFYESTSKPTGSFGSGRKGVLNCKHNRRLWTTFGWVLHATGFFDPIPVRCETSPCRTTVQKCFG